MQKEWAAFLSQGDEQAFFAIYTHYYHYLNFIGLKKNFKSGKVKDAVNDVFLILWENRDTLGHVQHHHNYIVTAFLRKLYRKEKFGIDEAEELGNVPEWHLSPSLEETHIHKHSVASAESILQDYIEQLPPKQRSLVYQKFYLGLSYQEIADANHISVNTVYNSIYKAIDKLKKLIGKEQLGILALAMTVLSVLLAIFLKKQ